MKWQHGLASHGSFLPAGKLARMSSRRSSAAAQQSVKRDYLASRTLTYTCQLSARRRLFQLCVFCLRNTQMLYLAPRILAVMSDVLLDASVSCSFGMLSATHVHMCVLRRNTPGRLYAGFTCPISSLECSHLWFCPGASQAPCMWFLFFSQDSTFTLRSRFYPVPADFRNGVRVTIDWTRVHMVRPVFALLVCEQCSHSLGARCG